MTTAFTPPSYRVAGNFIDGAWRACDRAPLKAIAPADGRLLCTLPGSGKAEVNAAIDAARAGAARMAKLGVWDRAALCQRIGEAIHNARERIAEAVSWDQGKPLAEALAETDLAAEGFRHAGELMRWQEGRMPSAATPGKRVTVSAVPKGVVGVITPWNFPVNIPTEYISAALAAGNAVAWVPAPTTALCAAVFMEVLVEADLPRGALNLVIGSGAEAGAALSEDCRIDAICFTGSPETGLKVARAAAGKSQLLELGGNGPVIVLDDADLDSAAAGAALGAYLNAGQVCSASERVLVHRSVHDRFVEKVLAATDRVRLGHPLDPATTMGPLNNAAVLEKIEAHITDARNRGAEILRGGSRDRRNADLHYFEPTVVTGLDTGSLLNREETFGPVLPILSFDDDDAILQAANDNRYGLCAAVYTESLKRAEYFSSALRTGIVNINDASIFWEPHIPFGGASGKSSGLGRIGGSDTINQLCDTRTVIQTF